MPNPNSKLVNFKLDHPSPVELATLKSSLLDAIEDDVTLDLTLVERVNTPLVQFAISAKRTWMKNNRNFNIITSSSALEDALRTLGVDHTELLLKEI